MGRYARKRMHKNKKDIGKACKAKRKTKDVDQIHSDLTLAKLKTFVEHEVDHDLPGSGQFYCVHCAKYFTDELTLNHHRKSKIHKRRLKELRDAPYSQEEANAAAGLGQYVKPQPVVVHDVSVVDLREPPPDQAELLRKKLEDEDMGHNTNQIGDNNDDDANDDDNDDIDSDPEE